jgi:EAL domain-containing protein (putative c-di-GMP-specific phosphodiesterase class I)
VQDGTYDPMDASIARAIIAMAHSLNMKVIAEGVETNEQLEYLRTLGCDGVQGFLFAPPVPVPEFTELLAEDTLEGELGAHRGSRPITA